MGRKMLLRKFNTFSCLMKEKPTNLKGKKHSSQQWIVRQLKDPYVEKAKQHDYRCRSAFKLLEINSKHHILQPGMNVIDCGAAPGSWTQVAARLVNADQKMLDKPVGSVIGIDKLPIYPIEGATLLANMDFTKKGTQDLIKQYLNERFVDVVLSDMAPNAIGMKDADHENIIKLAYSVFKFALEVSSYESTLVIKVWDGSMSPALEKDLELFYKVVKIARPQATRDESSEKFIIAKGFKGLKTQAKFGDVIERRVNRCSSNSSAHEEMAMKKKVKKSSNRLLLRVDSSISI
uniref:rRNA methyltransferase 2, mitochondrial n=1 Tax=Trichogramma kaykai TaxID=54128 RepID=A0ABD2XKP2_9HYME